MGNYYEINVTWRGHHFFATAPRSIPSRLALHIMYNKFKEKFTEEEGYVISVSHCTTTFESVEGFPTAEAPLHNTFHNKD